MRFQRYVTDPCPNCGIWGGRGLAQRENGGKWVIRAGRSARTHHRRGSVWVRQWPNVSRHRHDPIRLPKVKLSPGKWVRAYFPHDQRFEYAVCDNPGHGRHHSVYVTETEATELEPAGWPTMTDERKVEISDRVAARQTRNRQRQSKASR